jgi:hypothetical protein
MPEVLSQFSGKSKMAARITEHGKCRRFSQLFKSVLKICVAPKFPELCSIEKWQ